MALVKCIECGKEISDKATACPSCGYPMTANVQSTFESDCAEFSKFTKEQIWHIAYSKHYKGTGKNDLDTAVRMYKYIIDAHRGTSEADFAKAQLAVIESGRFKSANGSFLLNTGSAALSEHNSSKTIFSNTMSSSSLLPEHQSEQPNHTSKSSTANLGQFNKEQLFYKAYTLHYTGHVSDLSEIVLIYRYIIKNYVGSKESVHAQRQLEDLIAKHGDPDSGSVTSHPNNKIEVKLSYLHEFEKYRCDTGGKFEVHFPELFKHNNKTASQCYNNVTIKSPDANNTINNSWPFKMLSIAIVVLLIWIVCLFVAANHQNHDTFTEMSEAAVKRAEQISSLVKLVVVFCGLWFGVLLTRIFSKK